MHLFGLSKRKNKKKFRLGLRKSVSTGNIHDRPGHVSGRRESSELGRSDRDQDDVLNKTENTLKRLSLSTEDESRVMHAPLADDSVQSQQVPIGDSSSRRSSGDTSNNTGTTSPGSSSKSPVSETKVEVLAPVPSASAPASSAAMTVPSIVRSSPTVDPNDLDALLSLETQQRSDAAATRASDVATLRPSRLTFELPVTPPRARSPSAPAYPRPGPRRSRSSELEERRKHRYQSPNRKENQRHRRHHRHRWSLRYSSSDDESDADDAAENLQLGSRVNLYKRPLPTLGYVRYIGLIDNEPGEWIGVELDHRVANCDGSMRGKRYFTTDAQRGIFLKRDDLTLA
ncbi:CAP Gly-rich domain-containing protein [Gongronella butleri]|nr:CAP Gly-rich domain-containing protein [Gongronella butleri]